MATRFEFLDADITSLDVDAIVNAANAQLRPGGGVCGAIHAAAGEELARACAAIGSCPTGEAVITPGFGLKARHVIHAVGPVWGGGESGEDALLAGCYRASLKLAREHGLESIAFPAISTGIYGFPPARAARIAVGTCLEETSKAPRPARVIFCCFGAQSLKLHEEAFAALAP
ncbi:MAG: O-acetyl-ADP-ribose deacetylase [Methyloligellaceae bacterium]